MNVPKIHGVIERRILANYRVRPDTLAAILPAPFQPKLVNGWGIAGICLIRLNRIVPKPFPAWVGLKSENAAHRIAVTWQEGENRLEGVYVPRRDTTSLINVWVGGRIFPGQHHLAKFDIQETEDTFNVAMNGHDGVFMSVSGRRAQTLLSDSIFPSLQKASTFFEAGSIGYSATTTPGRYDGLELNSLKWRVSPLEVTEIRSSFFENTLTFPSGSIEFDCALLMENIPHEWHALEPLCVT